MNRMSYSVPMRHPLGLWLLAVCWLLLSALPVAAQSAGGQSVAKARIHWNARMDAAHTVSLRTVFDNTLQVEAVYVVQRGKVKREAVQCQHLQSSMLTATPLTFTFSCDFEYQGLHYRLRGQYSANASAPQQSIRCIPLTLGKDLMEQGGYQK